LEGNKGPSKGWDGKQTGAEKQIAPAGVVKHSGEGEGGEVKSANGDHILTSKR